MKFTPTLATLAFLLAAAPAFSADDGVTPADVRETAEEKGRTIRENTNEAVDKLKEKGGEAKDAGNREIERLKDAKDAAKEEWRQGGTPEADASPVPR